MTAIRANSMAALQWLLRAAHAAYLRYLIRAAEGDLRYMQHQIDHARTLPGQMAAHRDHIARLHCRLITGD